MFSRRSNAPIQAISAVGENDYFPLIEWDEIIECLREMNISVNDEISTHPTTQDVQNILEQWISSSFHINTESLRPAIQQAAGERDAEIVETGSGDRESITAETIESGFLFAFFLVAKKLLEASSIEDFSMMDIVRPEPTRLRRLLSSMINFARFWSQHSEDIEPFVQRSENLKANIAQARLNYDRVNRDIDSLKAYNSSVSDAKLMDENRAMGERLSELRIQEQKLTAAHADYKAAKSQLLRDVEDLNDLLATMTKRNDLVRPVVESSASFLTMNNDLIKSVADLEASHYSISSRSTKMATTVRSLQLITEHMTTINQQIEECLELKRRATQKIEGLKRLQSSNVVKQKEIDDLQYNLDLLNKEMEHSKSRFEAHMETSRTALENLEKNTANLNSQLQVLHQKNFELERDENLLHDEHVRHEVEMRRLDEEFKQEMELVEQEKALLAKVVKKYIAELTPYI